MEIGEPIDYGVPERPLDWKMDYSKLNNVTDHNGVLLTTTQEEKNKKRHTELWDSFRQRFNSIEYMEAQSGLPIPNRILEKVETLIQIEQNKL